MKKNRYFVHLLIIMGALFALPAMAQKEVRSLNREGNKLYKNKDYNKAEIAYRKALEKSSKDSDANYNLANTLFRTDRLEEALKLYGQVLDSGHLSPQKISDAAHNAGNVMMKNKQYDKAIELYKEALRKRPTDDETRYNLALAQKLLQEQKQDKKDDQKKDQDKKDDQKKDQDKKDDQKKDQDKKDDQNNKNANQNPPKDKKGNGANQSTKMSKENAQQILDAFLKDEKDTQQKLEKARMVKGKGRQNNKNW